MAQNWSLVDIGNALIEGQNLSMEKFAELMYVLGESGMTEHDCDACVLIAQGIEPDYSKCSAAIKWAVVDPFEIAKSTGKPVAIESGLVDCDGSAVDCSFDNLTRFAMPDGTTSEDRVHCH